MTERGDVRAVLEDLLDGLRSGAIAPPSTTAATVCFKLCEELASHLCSLVGAAPQPLLAKGAGSFLPTACDSQCTTSESDSETAHAKGRPSGRSRARFRRRQQQMQDQAPMTSYELHHCTGEKKNAFSGSKKSDSFRNRALHSPGSRTHTSKIRIFA